MVGACGLSGFFLPVGCQAFAIGVGVGFEKLSGLCASIEKMDVQQLCSRDTQCEAAQQLQLHLGPENIELSAVGDPAAVTHT